MKRLTEYDVEYIAHSLAIELMGTVEPIPPFSTRFPGKLESCLDQPFVTYGGVSLYRTYSQKSAILFYLVIKNHPFENGNKRMAVMITIVFLILNKKWLNTTPESLYALACSVAASPSKEKDATLKQLSEFFKNNTKPLKTLYDT